ncbi:hypothetical protein PC123_g28024 [Phytophthora cactorum]|nr:hypothetical protein PC123_g28024 [Phytophthora cactorum]
MQTCSISPRFKSRRKCFHERPGSCVIDAASHGGRATSTSRTCATLSSLSPTRADITSGSIDVEHTESMRGRSGVRRPRRRTGRGALSAADDVKPHSIMSADS